MPTCWRVAHLRELNAGRGHVVYSTALPGLLCRLRVRIGTVLFTRSRLGRAAGLAFDAHNGDLLEALLEARRLQALSHLLHHFVSHGAVALAVALHADGQWHVEEDG